MRKVDMTRFDLLKGTVTETCDIVAEEVPLRIVLNNIYTSIVWCSPSQFKELTTGFLYAEEILHNVDEIDSITTDEKENICNIQLKADIDLDSRLENRRGGARVVPLIKNSTSAYQHDDKITPVTSDLTVNAQTILDAINQINEKAEGFKKTGGLHDSGIFKADGTLIAFSEDVGRHNTVDKVIGKGILTKIDFTQCFLIITGRVPGDMIYKAAKAGLPIVASVAAVLNSGIISAQKANITLAGFIREKHINIYTHPKRIIL
ncbi:MAG: formate dehydrogenase accessory sulfurtransferase FdhD [Candidatus Bathyarchaeota archaeon]|nr:formate dehydrogenase accessory sulfurtransferase FdhD [Candidatus Termiticorpusculum sp.]